MKKVVAVVLRDVAFKGSNGRFTWPGILRVTAELNNGVAG